MTTTQQSPITRSTNPLITLEQREIISQQLKQLLNNLALKRREVNPQAMNLAKTPFVLAILQSESSKTLQVDDQKNLQKAALAAQTQRQKVYRFFRSISCKNDSNKAEKLATVYETIAQLSQQIDTSGNQFDLDQIAARIRASTEFYKDALAAPRNRFACFKAQTSDSLSLISDCAYNIVRLAEQSVERSRHDLTRSTNPRISTAIVVAYRPTSNSVGSPSKSDRNALTRPRHSR